MLLPLNVNKILFVCMKLQENFNSYLRTASHQHTHSTRSNMDNWANLGLSMGNLFLIFME